MDVSTRWVKVLDKGMITLPKSWREELGLKKGAVVQMKQLDRKRLIIDTTITPTQAASVPYRIYSKSELQQFIQEDKLATA